MSLVKRSKQKGLFEGKEKITRGELLQALRQDKGFVPGFVGSNLRRSERLRLAPIIFNPQKYPTTIAKWQFKKELIRLHSLMNKAQDEKVRESLEKKVKYLKKISGI